MFNICNAVKKQSINIVIPVNLVWNYIFQFRIKMKYLNFPSGESEAEAILIDDSDDEDEANIEEDDIEEDDDGMDSPERWIDE